MSTANESTNDYTSAAYRRWPKADVRGDGPFAVVTYCRPGGIVWLHRYEADAQAVYGIIQARGCDTECVHAHKIVRL